MYLIILNLEDNWIVTGVRETQREADEAAMALICQHPEVAEDIVVRWDPLYGF